MQLDVVGDSWYRSWPREGAECLPMTATVAHELQLRRAAEQFEQSLRVSGRLHGYFPLRIQMRRRLRVILRRPTGRRCRRRCEKNHDRA
jgi:hypothetical protein